MQVPGEAEDFRDGEIGVYHERKMGLDLGAGIGVLHEMVGVLRRNRHFAILHVREMVVQRITDSC